MNELAGLMHGKVFRNSVRELAMSLTCSELQETPAIRMVDQKRGILLHHFCLRRLG